MFPYFFCLLQERPFVRPASDSRLLPLMPHQAPVPYPVCSPWRHHLRLTTGRNSRLTILPHWDTLRIDPDIFTAQPEANIVLGVTLSKQIQNLGLIGGGRF